MSLPTKFVFVDIETSGPRVTTDRIIEIGVIRVEEGRVVERFESLINPQTYIPPFIEKFTGISPNMLTDAPSFADIKDKLVELMADCTFVAHNVRFDYGFIKNEFQRVGLPFSPKHFCTVRLSRYLYPQERRHNLDELITRFGFDGYPRHRAMGDAEIIWRFFERMQNEWSQETFEKALKHCLRKPSLPSAIPADTLDNLPEAPGVYIFYGENGYPLYVGKSKNLKERITSHFLSDFTSTREMHICQQVTSIGTFRTSGELGALLKEAMLVKQLQPLYNRKLRQRRRMILVRKHTTEEGYITATIETAETLGPNDYETVLGVFKSIKQAKQWLESVAKEHTLCQKILGLENSRGSCFAYQLEQCKGACTGEEEPETYNLRAIIGLTQHAIARWPFNGPILIEEVDSESGRKEGFVIDKWCLHSHMYVTESDQEPTFVSNELTFDVDTYKILHYFLVKAKSRPKIKQLTALPLG